MSLNNEYCLVETGLRSSRGIFCRNSIITLRDIANFAKSNNNTDVYCTIYQYNTKEQNKSDLYAPLYFDLDCNDLLTAGSEDTAFEIIREDAKKIIAILDAIFYIPEEQLKIYFSGGKGVHIVVPQKILGIQPRKDLNNIFHTLVTDIKKYVPNGTVDTKIYDNKRLFRLPNSIHGKSGLHKIPITAQELRTLSFADIKLLASQPRTVEVKSPVYSTRSHRMYSKYIEEWEKKVREMEDRKNKVYSNTFNYTPPCIKNILEEGITEGSRNNTLAALASFFKQQGLSQNECLDRLIQFNERLVMPALMTREVEVTVASIYEGEYKYGCRTLIEVGSCVESCKIAQKRIS